jgi:hypothetical protein
LLNRFDEYNSRVSVPARLDVIGPVGMRASLLVVGVLLVGAPNSICPAQNLPGDLGEKLEQAAIAEQMVQSCAAANPELAEAFAKGWRDWQVRNKEVWQAVEATRTITETPAGAAILHLFDALKEALKGQTRLAEINSTQAALMCKHVLSELTKGRLDYKPPSVKQ